MKLHTTKLEKLLKRKKANRFNPPIVNCIKADTDAKRIKQNIAEIDYKKRTCCLAEIKIKVDIIIKKQTKEEPLS